MPRFGTAEGPLPSAAPAATAMVSNDPLAGFVANAQPGATAEIAGYGAVRLARAYTAASGRDCREVLLGRGIDERAAIYCRQAQGESQAWAPARALLRGGTTRP